MWSSTTQLFTQHNKVKDTVSTSHQTNTPGHHKTRHTPAWRDSREFTYLTNKWNKDISWSRFNKNSVLNIFYLNKILIFPYRALYDCFDSVQWWFHHEITGLAYKQSYSKNSFQWFSHSNNCSRSPSTFHAVHFIYAIRLHCVIQLEYIWTEIWAVMESVNGAKGREQRSYQRLSAPYLWPLWRHRGQVEWNFGPMTTRS